MTDVIMESIFVYNDNIVNPITRISRLLYLFFRGHLIGTFFIWDPDIHNIILYCLWKLSGSN